MHVLVERTCDRSLREPGAATACSGRSPLRFFHVMSRASAFLARAFRRRFCAVGRTARVMRFVHIGGPFMAAFFSS